MIEVEYYFNTSSQWAKDLANSFSKRIGTEVSFKDNKLIFPSSVAIGRYEYYELSENLGMLCVDIVFKDEVLLHKKQLIGNDYYGLAFDVSEHNVKVTQSDGKKVNILDELVKPVVLSSHAFDSAVLFHKNVPVRYVQIFGHRSWGIKNLTEPIPLELTRFKEFANALPMHAIANFDNKSYDLVNEILELDTTRVNLIQLLEGYACQLIALFFNNLRDEYADTKNSVSPDAMRIIELKEIQEQNLTNVLTLSKAAISCFMSTSKFASMFQTLFKENYGEYFIRKKMERAKDFLNDGYSVSDTASTLGYNNIGYFAQTFKKYFNILPGEYKRSRKE
ncbi:helix-turn-helix domain-containing protein [Flavobacterium panacagri]|uniref:helix-turn-helix domain-containing protein n=1 Tax=Flavobacterium panacagri TaxID=3034146 RepID=UPI0025A5C2EC|nr:AraC family transcriptional regulator [Flavobacterium panacagri]